jgi:hypothetical protein
MPGLICGIALSAHLLMNGNYNAIHPYCNYETPKSYIAGAYYNSVDRMSLFAGYKWRLNSDISMDIVAVTGYYEYDIVPSVRLNYKNVFVMPAVEEDTVGIVVGLDFKF